MKGMWCVVAVGFALISSTCSKPPGVRVVAPDVGMQMPNMGCPMGRGGWCCEVGDPRRGGGGRGGGALRLRGGNGWRHPDGREPDFVDLAPDRLPPPPDEDFQKAFGSPEGDQAIALAQKALEAGDEEEARRQHEVACDRLTATGGISAKLDELFAIEDGIGWLIGNRTLEQERLAAESAWRPFWTVSQHLNLTEEQVGAIEGWIGGKLDPSRLLYLASRDGWTCREFHKRCDGKGATVTVVRTDTGHIFGGYTKKKRPARWEAEFVEDRDAFVFRVHSPRDFRPIPWTKVFGRETENVQDLFFEPYEAAEIRLAMQEGYDGVDEYHYEAARGQVFLGHTKDGRREVTNHDEEAEKARVKKAGGVGGLISFDDKHGVTRTLNADELSDWADDLDAFGSKDVEKPKEHDSGDDYLIPEQRFQKQMEQMTGANKALIEGNQRWGLDVKVDGIANQTVENKPPAEGGGLWMPPRGDTPEEEDLDLEPVGGRFVKCEHSGLNPEIPRVRHVWCKGPCWTHALELDLDNMRNSFSDLLSGALFNMPEGVSTDAERTLLAGKIGGRTPDEKARGTKAYWEIEEVAVIAV